MRVNAAFNRTYLDEEVCDAMRETGALLLPTRTIIAETLVSDELPPYAKAKMAAIARPTRRRCRAGPRAG